jgi:hypothetical protein
MIYLAKQVHIASVWRLVTLKKLFSSDASNVERVVMIPRRVLLSNGPVLRGLRSGMLVRTGGGYDICDQYGGVAWSRTVFMTNDYKGFWGKFSDRTL